MPWIGTRQTASPSDFAARTQILVNEDLEAPGTEAHVVDIHVPLRWRLAQFMGCSYGYLAPLLKNCMQLTVEAKMAHRSQFWIETCKPRALNPSSQSPPSPKHFEGHARSGRSGL